MSDLGEYLVDHGLLSRAQLDEAREAQVVYGGRLGTNLVELGALSLDDLGEHVAAHTGFPLAPKEWVEAPDAEALAAVSPDLAGRHGVLPLRYAGDELHVAMLDPGDARARDELRQSIGRAVRAYILPELRLRYALERHLGIPRSLRFINVAKKLERVRRTAAASGDEIPEEERLRSALGIAPLGSGEELIDESSFAQLHEKLTSARDRAQGGGPAADLGGDEIVLDEVAPDGPDGSEGGAPPEPGAGAPPTAEGVARTLASPAGDPVALEAELARALDGDAAARAGLALARYYVRCAALFVVHRGMVMGLIADGDGVAARIEGVLVPIDVESVFARAATQGEPFRGAPPTHGVDARVLRALGRAPARDVAVIPVSVRRRVVNLLYADQGVAPLARTTAAALLAVAECMSAAYERLILERKRVA